MPWRDVVSSARFASKVSFSVSRLPRLINRKEAENPIGIDFNTGDMILDEDLIKAQVA